MAPQIGFASAVRVIPRIIVMEKKDLTRKQERMASRQKGDLCRSSSWHDALRPWKDLGEFPLPRESEKSVLQIKINESREMCRCQILKNFSYQVPMHNPYNPQPLLPLALRSSGKFFPSTPCHRPLRSWKHSLTSCHWGKKWGVETWHLLHYTHTHARTRTRTLARAHAHTMPLCFMS